MILNLIFLAVMCALSYWLGFSRARREGNENLLAYARGSGDMLQSLGNSLPDPRPLTDQIKDFLAAHQYTVHFATNVGLAKRPDGTRAFTFSMLKPQFAAWTDAEWDRMIMDQIRYQLHRDKSGQHWSNSVIPIPREDKVTSAGFRR